jgi:integrase
MARQINILKQGAIASLPQGRHSDGSGLYCVVAAGGSRQWVLFYHHANKRREMGLGSASATGLSLADARKRAGEIRAAVASGRDPVAEKAAHRSAARIAQEAAGGAMQRVLFGDFAKDYILERKASWKDSRAEANWLWSIEHHAAPLLSMPIDDIRLQHVQAVLAPIWVAKQETAKKVRRRIEAILDAARVKGLIPAQAPNPAKLAGNLALVLPRAPRGDHHAALHYRDVPVFMKKLRARSITNGSLAFEFLILTATRTGEVLGSTWAEIDLEQNLWTIPASRMKASREHIVPLSGRAVDILKLMRPHASGDSAFVFPGQTEGRPLSNMAFLSLLRRMNIDVTAHGFRSSFRDWAGDCTTHDREVAEAALAHVVGGVEGAYRRATALKKRRSLMNEWAAYCCPKA